MRLAIISHTEHFCVNGDIVGLGPTVNEINHLLDIFDEIYHLAFLHDDIESYSNYIPYNSSKVHFIPLKPSGGKSIFDKFSVIYTMPHTLKKVNEVFQKVNLFQFRSPTGIGNYMIPLLTIFFNKNGWFKYAGNWSHPNPNMSYRFQRFYLKYLQRKKVTVNGHWKNQPSHIISFENPCIEEGDRKNGAKSIMLKTYKKPYSICFVGRFGEKKGEKLLLDALSSFPKPECFKKVHFVGEGQNMIHLKNKAKNIDIDIVFHGVLNRRDLFKIYESSDFILLPSESEGFPKVIAEASNFGAIPIVSSVSSIPHYIKNAYNGFLWDVNSDFIEFFNHLFLNMNEKELVGMSKNAFEMASLFTYNHYNDRIVRDILSR